MIVVDTNVIAYLYLPCEHTAHAEALLEREPQWCAPILWRSEFRNILAGQMRRRGLSFGHACALQREAEDLLAGGEYEIDSVEVLGWVRDSDCSAYDCEFIALAARLGTRVATMDRRLLRAFPTLAFGLDEACA